MQIATHPMQPSAQRMPSGWMRIEPDGHTCPLCSQSVLGSFRAR
jgi:hypothetical protein